MSDERKASERVKHDAKMTVYLTDAELLSIDHTLLELRRVYGLKVDRGRYVREALSATNAHRMAQRLRRSKGGDV